MYVNYFEKILNKFYSETMSLDSVLQELSNIKPKFFERLDSVGNDNEYFILGDNQDTKLYSFVCSYYRMSDSLYHYLSKGISKGLICGICHLCGDYNVFQFVHVFGLCKSCYKLYKNSTIDFCDIKKFTGTLFDNIQPIDELFLVIKYVDFYIFFNRNNNRIFSLTFSQEDIPTYHKEYNGMRNSMRLDDEEYEDPLMVEIIRHQTYFAFLITFILPILYDIQRLIGNYIIRTTSF